MTATQWIMAAAIVGALAASLWAVTATTLLDHEHRITKLEQKPDRITNTSAGL